jgi:hypothetical protein
MDEHDDDLEPVVDDDAEYETLEFPEGEDDEETEHGREVPLPDDEDKDDDIDPDEAEL